MDRPHHVQTSLFEFDVFSTLQTGTAGRDLREGDLSGASHVHSAAVGILRCDVRKDDGGSQRPHRLL